MILGFLPFVIFTLLANLSQDVALWAAFAAAFALALRDFAQYRVLRPLDTGSLAIFGAVALFAGFVKPDLSVAMTRLVVDLAFCALALLSLFLRRPLTLADANSAAVERNVQLRHYGLTWFWAAVFLLMAAADGFADSHKYLPQSLDGAVGLALLLLGFAVSARLVPHVQSIATSARVRKQWEY